nr:hypothetical protein [Tanacetum cinerariifolium]
IGRGNLGHEHIRGAVADGGGHHRVEGKRERAGWQVGHARAEVEALRPVGEVFGKVIGGRRRAGAVVYLIVELP